MKSRAFTRLCQGLALALLASMLVTALHDASQAWDVAYYHLPFAARLVGLSPGDAYVFSAANEARYAGFALLAEALQGLLWRITGRPESANLVAFASVPLVAWFARRRLGVPWHLTVLSLLAIPLVQTHATSAYVDLPGNAAATVLALLAIEAWASPKPVDARTTLLAALSAAIAANVKPMLHPIVLASLGALAARIFVTRAPRERARLLGLLFLALPLVFATPLKNLVLHGNPYFPVRLTLLGHSLPGPEEPYASSPAWLASSPRPVRFLCSMLELGARPFADPRRWTVDQWTPPDEAGYRMGGFFGAYVVVQVAALAWRALREGSREARAAGLGFLALTGVTSLMPQSHELRYYLSWMMTLVVLNAWLASRPGAPRRGPRPSVLGAAAILALAVVLGVTRGVYAYPAGSTFDAWVRARVDEHVVGRIGAGERVCVDREPFNFLWAPLFHPERRYTLKEAEDPAECAGYRRLE